MDGKDKSMNWQAIEEGIKKGFAGDWWKEIEDDKFLGGEFWEDLEYDEMLGDNFWQDITNILPKSNPRVDILRMEKEIIVIIEIPGISTVEAVHLGLVGNKLYMEGEIPALNPIPKENIIQKERFTGSFSRTIELPAQISSQGLSAQINHGLVTVHVPLRPDEEGINIPITYEGIDEEE